MYLKPTNNSHGTNGMLYKRFISLESSRSLNNIYKTSDNKYWTFDYDTISFKQFIGTIPAATTIVTITSAMVLTYLTYYMYYTTEWVIVETLDTTGLSLLSAKYNNVGTYQTNKYYFAGSFDYMIKGDITGTTGQRIKGLITPMSSFTIRWFNDNIIIRTDDLVVIDNRLYSVEDSNATIKKPSNYKIYYATLNNIL